MHGTIRGNFTSQVSLLEGAVIYKPESESVGDARRVIAIIWKRCVCSTAVAVYYLRKELTKSSHRYSTPLLVSCYLG